MRIVDREKTLRYIEDEILQMKKQAEARGQEVIERAQSKAGEIIEQAQAQAEQVIAHAHTQANSIREAARQEGHQQGDAAAREQVRQEVAGLMADLARILQEARQALQDTVFNQEREIRRLVAQIASKVVLATIEADNETVVRIARECIRRATGRQTLTLLMHPEDRAIIERYCPEFRAAFDDLERIELREEPRVRQGGVIVETASGGVDARIHQQLEVVRDTLVPEDIGQPRNEENSIQHKETPEPS
jgi:flagellar assembly protein FliH